MSRICKCGHNEDDHREEICFAKVNRKFCDCSQFEFDEDEEMLDEIDCEEIKFFENMKMGDCICGAWWLNEASGEFVHIADCVCGRT